MLCKSIGKININSVVVINKNEDGYIDKIGLVYGV